MFNWTTFPKVTLEELARERDLRVTYAAEDLEDEFGSPPSDDFVKELWPTLREEWLGRSPESRLNVVRALRAKGLGDAEARISTKAGQMDHLRSCRMSANLRAIVHNEFLRAGQPEAPDENPPDVPTTESSVTSSQPLDDPTPQNIQPTGDTADRAIPAAPAPGPAPSQPSTEPDGEHGFFGRLWDKVTGGGNDGEPRPITEPDTPIAQHPAAVTTKPDRKGASVQPAAPLTSPDAGLRAVEMLFEQMMIDEEWATRRPRGFTWWAYRLAQHVEAGEPYEVAPGVFGSNVRVWTDVVEGVENSKTPPTQVLSAVNGHQVMSALTWDPERNSIEECATCSVFDDTVDMWAPILATAALFQNSAAHSRAHALTEVVGGRPAQSTHPSSGERPEMDSILDGPAEWAATVGQEPSAFIGAGMSGIPAFAEQFEIFSTADESGFTAQIPLVEIAEVNWVGSPRNTALVQAFTDQPHPEVGSGALWLLRLPQHIEESDVADLANQLNLMESRGDAPCKLLGAWVGREDGLAHVSFLPTVIARPMLLENLLIDAAVRAKWATQLLATT